MNPILFGKPALLTPGLCLLCSVNQIELHHPEPAGERGQVRQLGFAHRRHLGTMQMTTDTALLTCERVIQGARSALGTARW